MERMIYTVTLNPSIDYIVGVEDFKPGKTNRTTFEQKFPGGKGINVSRVLKELEMTNTALGFVGGFTGKYIVDSLHELGIATDFIDVKDDTRINIKLKSDVESEINGQGPNITEDEIQQLRNQFSKLTREDTVILSGSKPPSLPKNFYETVIQWIDEQGADFIIDTHANELLQVLPYQPLLIKPNKEELEELFHITIKTPDEVIPYGKELVNRGAQHVILSLGGDGAYFFTKDDVFYGQAPEGKVLNSVGAGDSMIAGFTAEYLTSHDRMEAFKVGIAAGSATAFSEDLATKKDIEKLLQKIEITKI